MTENAGVIDRVEIPHFDLDTEIYLFLNEERRTNLNIMDKDYGKRADKVRERVEELIEKGAGKTGGLLLENARLNQQYSEELYRLMVDARSGESNDKVKETALLARLLWRLSSFRNPEGAALGRFLSGCRAQAGLMFSLDNLGYLIYTPISEEEIKLLDLHGIDFVAISPRGEMLFIDAKSQATEDVNGSRYSKSGVSFEQGKIDSGVLASVLTHTASFVGSIKWEGAQNLRHTGFCNLRYACLKIFVPTRNEFMDKYGRMTPVIVKQLEVGLKKAEIESWV